MNNTWKRFTLIALGAGLAVTVGISAVGTTFAQNASSNQAQTQQDGSGFMQRGGPRGMHRDGGRGGFSPTVVAKALGISEDELRTAQQDGKTIADLASEKGVALDTIIDAIIADETTRLDQAVTDGKITQEQADQRLSDLKSNLPDMLSQTPPANLGPGGFGRGGHLGGPGSSAVIAKALGITEDELRTAFQASKSVADLASEKGVALDTIVNAIIADETTHLSQAVTDGKITQAQADQRLADLKANLPDQLSQVPPADGGHGGFGHGDRMGGPASPTVIAQALRITEDELRTAFQDGKSVADVAKEKNIALDTVINAIVADATTHLNQEVTDGKITQAEADQRLADLKTNLPDMLSQVPPARPEGMGGHRGPGGFGPGSPDSNQPAPDSSNGSSSSSSVAPALQVQDTSL